jgi:hypothetical protein
MAGVTSGIPIDEEDDGQHVGRVGGIRVYPGCEQ